jgi:hypothetical protein
MPVPTTDYVTDDIILTTDEPSTYVSFTVPNYLSNLAPVPWTWRVTIQPPDAAQVLTIAGVPLPPVWSPLVTYQSACERDSLFENYYGDDDRWSIPTTNARVFNVIQSDGISPILEICMIRPNIECYYE